MPVRRIPFGAHEQRLHLEKREGFHRHWFNDRPGRVQRAEAAGYAFVLDTNGKPETRPVGVREGGGGLIAYAMEIPQELYDEDFLAGQKVVDDIDASIKQGKLAAKEPDARYTPAGRKISIEPGR